MVRVEFDPEGTNNQHVEISTFEDQPVEIGDDLEHKVFTLTKEPKHVLVDSLPFWIKHRLAVLSTISADPPTAWVSNIGRRINEHIFWVFKDKQDEDIDDSGKES
jgi:hypothetical protein